MQITQRNGSSLLVNFTLYTLFWFRCALFYGDEHSFCILLIFYDGTFLYGFLFTFCTYSWYRSDIAMLLSYSLPYFHVSRRIFSAMFFCHAGRTLSMAGMPPASLKFAARRAHFKLLHGHELKYCHFYLLALQMGCSGVLMSYHAASPYHWKSSIFRYYHSGISAVIAVIIKSSFMRKWRWHT